MPRFGKLTSRKKKTEVGVFGVPLDSICNFDEATDQWTLPHVVTHTLIRIGSFQKEEGIFRLSGEASKINEVKSLYDNHQPVDISKVDPNACCGLLKLFLRELPEPLLTYPLYKPFVTCQGDFEEEQDYLRHLIHNLPGPRKRLFLSLFSLLHSITKYKDHNLMDGSNLAVVIGPTVLQSNSSNMVSLMADATSVNNVTTTMITHYNQLKDPPAEDLFRGVAEVTSSFVDSEADVEVKSGDIVFLKNQNDSKWVVSKDQKDFTIPSSALQIILTFGSKKASSPELEKVDVKRSESGEGPADGAGDIDESNAQQIDDRFNVSLVNFCTQSCLVMQQLQEENEQLRETVRSLYEVVNKLLPEEAEKHPPPTLPCASKSALVVLSEQLQEVVEESNRGLEGQNRLSITVKSGSTGCSFVTPPSPSKEAVNKTSSPQIPSTLSLEETIERSPAKSPRKSPAKSPARSPMKVLKSPPIFDGDGGKLPELKKRPKRRKRLSGNFDQSPLSISSDAVASVSVKPLQLKNIEQLDSSEEIKITRRPSNPASPTEPLRETNEIKTEEQLGGDDEQSRNRGSRSERRARMQRASLYATATQPGDWQNAPDDGDLEL